MSNMIRTAIAGLALAGSSIALGGLARGQDEPKPTGPDERPAAQETVPAAETPAVPAGPKTYPPFRRVPSFFGQVGLSDQQRSEIYVLRGRYRAEIYELERQIEELKRKEITECETILTDSQRKLLNQLRDLKGPRSASDGN
jgi:hypothetical protein